MVLLSSRGSGSAQTKIYSRSFGKMHEVICPIIYLKGIVGLGLINIICNLFVSLFDCRMSYHQRVCDNVPESFSPLLPAEPVCCFRYEKPNEMVGYVTYNIPYFFATIFFTPPNELYHFLFSYYHAYDYTGKLRMLPS